MTTDKYGLHEIEYSVQGWDAIMNSDMQKLDSVIHTNLLATLGESVSAYQAVGMFAGETKYKLAQANGTLQPALGLALVAGVLDDEINIQRVGPITNSGWSFAPGKPVYLSPSTPGGVTQGAPGSFPQYLGMAISAITLLLNGSVDLSSLATTSTTSTTTTTTTTTV